MGKLRCPSASRKSVIVKVPGPPGGGAVCQLRQLRGESDRSSGSLDHGGRGLDQDYLGVMISEDVCFGWSKHCGRILSARLGRALATSRCTNRCREEKRPPLAVTSDRGRCKANSFCLVAGRLVPRGREN